MSKETLNAETFLEIQRLKIYNPMEGYIITYSNLKRMLNEFAEAYHKAKVNAITDEEINKYINTNHNLSDRVGSAKGLIKWFKNRLLNG